MQMTQRREERLIRMHREQRDHDRKLNLEYNDLMKSYAEQAKNWTLHEALRLDEMRKKEDEAMKKQEEV